MYLVMVEGGMGTGLGHYNVSMVYVCSAFFLDVVLCGAANPVEPGGIH